jgi:hypothetical protein
MRSWDALPDHSLAPAGDLSRALLDRGVADFRSAAGRLQQLPYGRNADRGDYRLVLEEGRGTCSTKHAFLAALALEQQLEVALMIGIYAMSEANTPGVGPVLSAHQLESLPEAHCYLCFDDERIDITRSGAAPTAEIEGFDPEWQIAPHQIGEHKQQLHREHLRAWYAARAHTFVGISSFEALWTIREQCIEALTESD